MANNGQQCPIVSNRSMADRMWMIHCIMAGANPPDPWCSRCLGILSAQPSVKCHNLPRIVPWWRHPVTSTVEVPRLWLSQCLSVFLVGLPGSWSKGGWWSQQLSTVEMWHVSCRQDTAWTKCLTKLVKAYWVMIRSNVIFLNPAGFELVELALPCNCHEQSYIFMNINPSCWAHT